MRLILMGGAASLGGMLWVLLAYWMKVRFRVNEIISTLLMNYIASYFLLHLLYGAWQDSKTRFLNRPHTSRSSVCRISGTASTARFWSRWRRPWWRDGASISAAPGSTCASSAPTPTWQRWWGFRCGPSSIAVIAVSGVAAGLAGFVNVASQEGRLTQSFFDGYVFSGVLIAFLSRNDPIVVVIVGFLLAVLFVTGQTLQVFYQIPFTMVQLIEAIIVIAVASSEFLIRHRIRWTR